MAEVVYVAFLYLSIDCYLYNSYKLQPPIIKCITKGFHLFLQRKFIYNIFTARYLRN